MTGSEWAVLITAATGLIATLVKNSRDIELLKKYSCYRNPCPDRIQSDAPQSKTSKGT